MAGHTLITGASGGIGHDLAVEFARHGHSLTLVARSERKLEELARRLSEEHQVSVDVIAMDLAAPDAAQRLIHEVDAHGHMVDILVNNAGFATYGPFVEIEAEKEHQMLMLNMVTLTDLTKGYLPEMVKRRSGKILNVASTAAFQPGPLMAAYYASKAYVLHLSEAIAEEVDGTGVTVSTLCPGPVETGFQERAEMEDSKLVQQGLQKSEEVARIAYEGLMQGRRVIYTRFSQKLLAFSTRFAPRSVLLKVVKKAQEKKS